MSTDAKTTIAGGISDALGLAAQLPKYAAVTVTNNEKRATAERLQALPGRYRVVADPEGWPMIPGRAGRIEVHDTATLAVYTDRPRLFAKIWCIPGVRRHQTGDTEMRAVFPPEALTQVAQVIGAKRKRSLSSEQARGISGLVALKSVPTPTLKAVSATKEPRVRAKTAGAQGRGPTSPSFAPKRPVTFLDRPSSPDYSRPTLST
jgi:hypothetical protein